MAEVFFSSSEDKYIKAIFDFLADVDWEDAKAVSASKVKQLFQMTKLESKILKLIWAQSATNK